MKKTYYLCVCILISCMFTSCKSDNDYNHTPPKMRLDSLYTEHNGPVVSTYLSYSYPDDTLVQDIILDDPGTAVKLFYVLNCEADIEQLDVQLYGISGAKFVRSAPADTTLLNGNASLQWKNTTIRKGFKTGHYDEFQVYIPAVSQASSVVVLATDDNGFQQAYTINIEVNN